MQQFFFWGEVALHSVCIHLIGFISLALIAPFAQATTIRAPSCREVREILMMTDEDITQHAQAIARAALGESTVAPRPIDQSPLTIWQKRTLEKELITRIYNYFTKHKIPNPNNPKVLKTLTEAKALLLIVHQNGRLSEKTKQLLKENPELASIALISEAFPGASQSLISKVTALLYSQTGSINVPIGAKEIHLVGGFCDQCLSTAGNSSLRLALKSSQDKLTLVIHTDQVYSEEGVTLKKLISSTSTVPSRVFRLMPDLRKSGGTPNRFISAI